MIPVRVLNLPRDSERRAWITMHLSGLGIPYTIIPAIDGRAILDDDALPDLVRFQRWHGRAMTRGELGCARTHLQVIRAIAAGPDPMVCVMEDDIEIDPAAIAFLDERVLADMPPFDVLRFFSNDHRQHKPAWQQATAKGRAVVAPLRTGWGTQAQIYTREGASKVASLEITAPIDNMIYCDSPPFGFRILEIRSSLVSLRNFGSNTDGYEKRRGAARTIYAFKALKHQSLAWLSFVMAWGPRGVAGLATSRYRP